MRIFWSIFILWLILHQDFWNCSSEETLFLGMPTGLFYHAVFSVACSILGAWAVLRAWPVHWEKYADRSEKSSVCSEHQSKDGKIVP